jgi:hypothetical protein
MKATSPWSNEVPYRSHGDGVRATAGIVFVGNVLGHNENRFNIGAQFSKKEVIVHQGANPASGFNIGDAFVFYKTGTGIVLRKTQRSKKKVHLYPMTQDERKQLAKGIRQAERELRWRTGSYCEKETRKKTAIRVRRQAAQERSRLKRKHGN